jgi:lipid-binding SYLF domain-containing protein
LKGPRRENDHSDGPIEEVRNRWNLLADDWRTQVGDDGGSNRRLDSDPALWESAGDVSRRAVLDAACVTGYLSRKLRDRGALVIGVDLSERTVELTEVDCSASTNAHASLLAHSVPRDTWFRGFLGHSAPSNSSIPPGVALERRIGYPRGLWFPRGRSGKERTMRRMWMVSCAAALAALTLSTARAAAQPSVRRTLDEATDVLTAMEMIPAQCIPQAVLANAQGVAIIPRVVKAGFVVGGRAGHGLVYSKLPDGAWTGPAFVHVGGASVGIQAGIEATDLVLVFKTRRSLERLLRGKDQVTLGAGASVAAGPIGREAQAGTDAALRAEVYSYSRSRGLFAGVSFEGAVIAYDHELNRAFERSRPEVKAEAARLARKIIAASGQQPPPPPVVVVPAPPPTAPPVVIPPAPWPPPPPRP